MYADLLNWLQKTLRAAGKKEESWLSAFYVTLGFAMMLQKQQRDIHFQTDAKAHKHKRSVEEAQQEAQHACRRIHEKYMLFRW